MLLFLAELCLHIGASGICHGKARYSNTKIMCTDHLGTEMRRIMKCKNCGAEVGDNVRFCEVCGQPIERDGENVTAQPSSMAGSGYTAALEEPEKKSKVPLFICIAVLVAAVIGIVAFAMPMIKKSMMKPADFMQYVEKKGRDEGSEKLKDYFGLMKKSLDTSSGSRKGTFQVEITDDVKSIINSYLSSYAMLYGIQIPNLSGLNDISLDVETDMKKDVSCIDYGLKVNGENILTAKMYMDYAGKKLYYQIPELSPAYLDSSSAFEQGNGSGLFSLEYLQGLQAGEFLPDADTAVKIFERYTDVLIQSIQNVEKKKDQTCEAEGVSVKADLYTAKYEGKDAVALFKKLISSLKDDDEILSYVEKLGGEKKEIQSGLEDALKNCENLKGFMTLSDHVSGEEIIGREIKFFESDDAKEPEMVISWLMPRDKGKLGFSFGMEYKSEELIKISGSGTLKGSILDGEFSVEAPKLMEAAGQMISGEVVHIKVSDYDVRKAGTEGTGKYEITVPGIAQISAFKLVMESSGTVDDFKEKIDVMMGEQKLCTLNLTGSKGESLDMALPGSSDKVYDVANEGDVMKYAAEIDTAGVLEHVKEVTGIDLLPFLSGSLEIPEN